MSQYLRQLGNVLQCLVALAIVAGLAALWPGLGRGAAHRVLRWIGRVSRSSVLSALVAGSASLVVSLAIVAIAGPPHAQVHDEFAYLLMADTFAHGRVTNPTPDCWISFETMHELMTPTYASKFGVAQGLSLALGQVVFHAPWVGVTIVTALAVAALTWCVRAFVPPRWALFGGLLAAVHPQILIWGHQYWGGNIGMLGGALVLGSLARIVAPRRPGRQPLPIAGLATTLALGLAVLANSRPYETAVWGLIIAVALAIWFRQRAPRPRIATIARLVLPCLVVLAPVAGAMAYYNWRVTGHPMQLPYTLHSRQYMAVPLFFWQKPPPPRTYNNEQLREQHEGFERGYFEEQRTLRGWFRWAGYKIYYFSELHLLRNLVITIGLIGLLAKLADSNRQVIPVAIRLALFAAGAFILAYAIIPWFESHYAGQATPILFILALTGARHVRASGPRGRALLRFATVSCALVLAFVVLRERRNNSGGFATERYQIEQRLVHRPPGRHLVFVRYGPKHDPGLEWDYNQADIEASPVIWARDLGDEKNLAVIARYGAGRQVWLLEVQDDGHPADLQPLLSDRNAPR